MVTIRSAVRPRETARSEVNPPNEWPTTAASGPTTSRVVMSARANSGPVVVRPGESPCAGPSSAMTRYPAATSGSTNALSWAPRPSQPCTSSTVGPAPHAVACSPPGKSSRAPRAMSSRSRAGRGWRRGHANSFAANHPASAGLSRPATAKKKRIDASIASASVSGARQLAGVLGLARLASRRDEPLLLRQYLDLLVDRASVVHRAELRTAHRAELGALEVLGRQRLVVVFASALRIERELELLVPVEAVTGPGERVVAIGGTGPPARDVGGVRGDLVGDHAVAHILRVRQAEVLLRRDVAEHVGAIPADHRRPDRARDVVVARRDVGDERSERVEGCFVADLLLLADVHLYLMHGYVPRTFHHHLHVLLPRALRQLAQRLELGELRAVARVVDRTGPQRVAERDGHVVLQQDVEHVVVALVERILLAMMHHPHGVQRAAAAHDARHATVHERQVLEQDAGVDGHVVHALLRLVLDHVEQLIGGEIGGLVHLLDGLVDRHRADGHRRRGDDRFAGLVQRVAGREVHYRIGAVFHRELELLELAIDVAGDGGVADVRVDLDLRHLSHGHRHERAGEVVYVGGNDEAAAGHLTPHELGAQLLPLGDDTHRVGDDAVARRTHLRVALGAHDHLWTPYAGANRIRFNGTLSAGDGRVAGTPVMGGS